MPSHPEFPVLTTLPIVHLNDGYWKIRRILRRVFAETTSKAGLLHTGLQVRARSTATRVHASSLL